MASTPLCEKIRGCANGILTIVANKLDCSYQYHWVKLHVRRAAYLWPYYYYYIFIF